MKAKINKIISIVPQLPPQVNGIGDFAFYLARNFKTDFEIETLFLRTEKTFIENNQVDFKEEFLEEKSSKALFEKLEEYNSDLVLLHYVGYAYSSKGCPYWLISGIEAWKKNGPGRKILTIFHELYANGYFWQSAFWFHLFQKKLTFRLLKLSDYSITNTPITYGILKSAMPDKDLLMLPVFSNIGEPQCLPEFSNRNNTLVIFGSSFLRNKIFNNYKILLFWLEKYKIDTIIEIGPKRETGKSDFNKIKIVQKGILTAVEVSDLLLQCKFGMLCYRTSLLTKSGVFAAYASHGIVPIIVNSERYPLSNELKPEAHYISEPHNHNFDAISKNVISWYHGHNLSNTTRMILKMINDSNKEL